MLAQDVAVAALAKSVKVGLDVHAGKLGPRAFYDSEEAYLEAMLRSRLKR